MQNNDGVQLCINSNVCAAVAIIVRREAGEGKRVLMRAFSAPHHAVSPAALKACANVVA